MAVLFQWVIEFSVGKSLSIKKFILWILKSIQPDINSNKTKSKFDHILNTCNSKSFCIWIEIIRIDYKMQENQNHPKSSKIYCIHRRRHSKLASWVLNKMKTKKKHRLKFRHWKTFVFRSRMRKDDTKFLWARNEQRHIVFIEHLVQSLCCLNFIITWMGLFILLLAQTAIECNNCFIDAWQQKFIKSVAKWKWCILLTYNWMKLKQEDKLEIKFTPKTTQNMFVNCLNQYSNIALCIQYKLHFKQFAFEFTMWRSMYVMSYELMYVINNEC